MVSGGVLQIPVLFLEKVNPGFLIHCLLLLTFLSQLSLYGLRHYAKLFYSLLLHSVTLYPILSHLIFLFFFIPFFRDFCTSATDSPPPPPPRPVPSYWQWLSEQYSFFSH